MYCCEYRLEAATRDLTVKHEKRRMEGVRGGEREREGDE